jgi:penicillin-binding protein 1A
VAPFFVEWVKQDLIDRLGAEAVFGGGLRVHTTLDPAVQARAEAARQAVLPGAEDPEVALACLEHETGNVIAMVGGRDFATNQFNLAAQGRRQPGSAFKPFVLAAAMREGVSPEAVFDTSPYTVEVEDGTWRVDNYEGAFPDSRLTLRDATVWSVNAVYARLVIQVGPEVVAETAHDMGITTPIEPNPAIALGGLTQGVSPLEMASAYGTIASGGIRHEPTVVSSVTDEEGDIVYEAPEDGERVLPEPLAVEISRILHEVVTRGTGAGADIGSWAAGKTGTTQSYRDAWFVGYSGDLVTAVWVGYPQGQVEMTDVHGIRVSGGTYPATIWRQFMSKLPDRQAAEAPEPTEPAPEDIETPEMVLCRVCTDSLKKAGSECESVVELYLQSDQVPEEVCDLH